MLWQQAYTAAGAPADELDYTSASNTELRQMRERYHSELGFAPYWVHDELRDARLAATGYQRDAVLWRAEAQRLQPGTPQRTQAEADVNRAGELAALYQARAEHLQIVAAAREQWRRDTEPARVRFELAGDELTRRGLPRDPEPAPTEQTALFEVDEPDREPAREQQPARDPDLDRAQAAQAAIDAALAVARDVIHESALDGVERDQAALFAVSAAAADLAGAQNLREPNEAAEDYEAATVAQARRQAEISTAIRAERAPWTEAITATAAWQRAVEEDTRERDDAHRRRHQPATPGHQLDRVLDLQCSDDQSVELTDGN